MDVSSSFSHGVAPVQAPVFVLNALLPAHIRLSFSVYWVVVSSLLCILSCDYVVISLCSTYFASSLAVHNEYGDVALHDSLFASPHSLRMMRLTRLSFVKNLLSCILSIRRIYTIVLYSARVPFSALILFQPGLCLLLHLIQPGFHVLHSTSAREAPWPPFPLHLLILLRLRGSVPSSTSCGSSLHAYSASSPCFIMLTASFLFIGPVWFSLPTSSITFFLFSFTLSLHLFIIPSHHLHYNTCDVSSVRSTVRSCVLDVLLCPTTVYVF